MSRGAVDYLVFPVALPAQGVVYHGDSLVTVEVTPQMPQAFSPLPPTGAAQATQPRPPEPGVGPLSLTQAIEKALAVHEPARIALEEADLAMLKVREARRNLFPGASLKATRTDGTAGGVDFREMQYGLQVEHPLYDAGRLRDAYKQALVNLQVAQKRYEKVRSDFTFDVAQAYFEAMSARQGVTFREQLLTEAEQTMEMTTRRFQAGLVTQMELLNVQSQLSQARYQLQAARNDLATAQLKLRHRMRWSSGLPIELPEAFPSTEVQVDLKEALQMAATQRPDLAINTLLVEFHKYEERLAKKKGAWKLDLTGFLGQSAGAFETEPLNLDTDFSAGLKLSKPWAGNTGAVTFTKVETSPRVGQTTRTDSATIQGELGVLNALSGATEIQQASVGRLKAEEDLAENRRLMEQEVHEAYYAYQKAVLTLAHAGEKAQYRSEQVKILKAQLELSEILPSQLLEAQLQWADDHVSKSQAQASIHVALARLNKAIGVAAYY